MPDILRDLDAETLKFFASKGLTGGRGVPVGAGEANGARVRRVLQVTADLSRLPLNKLEILDLACGEGVFAIEAALRGAKVLAVDARTTRMNDGWKIVQKLGLDNLRFDRGDIRQIRAASVGRFDVVYALGILYHLDVEDNFSVLRSIYEICREFVVIDTSIADSGAPQVPYSGGVCEGLRVREHSDGDAASTRQARPLASIDNTFSFRFTKRSLIRGLRDVGFSSVFECVAPLEPTKPDLRVTLVALKGEETRISTYPWINSKTEDEIASFLMMQDEKNRQAHSGALENQQGEGENRGKRLAKLVINSILRPFHLEVRRRT